MNLDLSVYLVTDAAQSSRRGRTLVETVEEAVAGGVTTVQVREKQAPARMVLELVEQLAVRLPAHVTLLVNDRVDIAHAARSRGARLAGVHVGQHDLPVESVRAILGPDAVIGLSTSTAEQLAEAVASPARVTYVGIGAVRTTTSKIDAPRAIGIDGVGRLARSCPLPAVAIGGITADDVVPLRAAGLAGAAVVSWVCDSPAPRRAAQQLADAWGEAA